MVCFFVPMQPSALRLDLVVYLSQYLRTNQLAKSDAPTPTTKGTRKSVRNILSIQSPPLKVEQGDRRQKLLYFIG